jgi:hypothetical protein
MSKSAATKATLLTFKTSDGRRIAICPITKMAVAMRLESEPKSFGSIFHPNIETTRNSATGCDILGGLRIQETFETMVTRLRNISAELRSNGELPTI